MMTDIQVTIVVVLAFVAVSGAIFAIGQLFASRERVHSRIVASANIVTSAPRKRAVSWDFDHLVKSYFDEKTFGIEGQVRTQLRRRLLRAGFFNTNAVNYYIFARLASVVVVTAGVYFLVEALTSEQHWLVKFALVAVAMFVAVLGPDAYLARRERMMHDAYRMDFPDLLDLVVVCIDSGLSLEGAIDRVAPQVSDQNPALGTNLMLMGAEIRAGRSTMDALESLADRLGIDEARTLSGMLRQSIELGTDVGDALRAFSDEMRDRRLLRAEERANQLPVKMVAPLGMFIFPVILLTVMLPVVLRLISLMGK